QFDLVQRRRDRPESARVQAPTRESVRDRRVGEAGSLGQCGVVEAPKVHLPAQDTAIESESTGFRGFSPLSQHTAIIAEKFFSNRRTPRSWRVTAILWLVAPRTDDERVHGAMERAMQARSIRTARALAQALNASGYSVSERAVSAWRSRE